MPRDLLSPHPELDEGDLLLCRRPLDDIRLLIREIRRTVMIVNGPRAQLLSAMMTSLVGQVDFADQLLDLVPDPPARRPIFDLGAAAATHAPVLEEDAGPFSVDELDGAEGADLDRPLLLDGQGDAWFDGFAAHKLSEPPPDRDRLDELERELARAYEVDRGAPEAAHAATDC